MKTVAVYGSLKKGFYNHERMGMGDPIGKSKVSGAMYLYHSFPKLYHPLHSDPNKVNDHEVEIYEVDDETHHRIYVMEVGAGYVAQTENFTLEDGEVIQAQIFYALGSDKNETQEHLTEYSAETVPNACVN